MIKAGFNVTIITRIESQSLFPPGIPVIRTEYTTENLTTSLAGQDAVVCTVGPGGLAPQVNMIDAAVAAGVKRFILNDFGWGPDHRGYPEFKAIGESRRVAWDHAKQRSEANPNFTYTGISIGNPIDWVSYIETQFYGALISAKGTSKIPNNGIQCITTVGNHI